MTSLNMKCNPKPWRPMAGLFLSSNHMVQLPDAEERPDSRTARRLNFVRMPKVFPDDDGKSLKAEINKGTFNSELFWLTLQIYLYLSLLGGRKRMHPIPPRLPSETQDLLCGDASRLIQLWVEENCEGANVYNDMAPPSRP